MDLKTLLLTIKEISYPGHPDGRESRLELINRYVIAALTELEQLEKTYDTHEAQH